MIVHLNYDYDVIFDTMISNNELEDRPYMWYLTSDSNLLITHLSYQAGIAWELWKTDIYGNILQKKQYPELYQPSEILELPEEDRYVVFGQLLDGVQPALNFINKNTLEIEGNTPIIDDITEGAEVMGVKYLSAHNALMYVMNMGMNTVTWDTTMLAHPNIHAYHVKLPQNSYNGEDGNMRWIGDNVYVGTAVPGHFFDMDGVYATDNVVVLQRFNIQGDILWSRSYMDITDRYHYHTTDICTDAKGNIIVFARRYYIDGEAERDIIYFKVDPVTGDMIEWEQ